MQITKLKNILEAVLLGADRTLTVNQLEALFELDEERPTRDEIRKALHEMADDYEPRGYELKQVASGFRLQVKQEYATWVGRLWEEKPARYTRALLETMALIAYRQPITRGEIEEVRGVSVSSNIIKTLLEREWIKVLGHKDVPGRPSLYGTTKTFLDYFNLKSLDQLPTLAEIKDLDSINPELALDDEHASDKKEGDEDSKNEDSSDGQSGNEQSFVSADVVSANVASTDQISADSEAETTVDGFVSEPLVTEALVTEALVTEEPAVEVSATEELIAEGLIVEGIATEGQATDEPIAVESTTNESEANESGTIESAPVVSISEHDQEDETDALRDEEKQVFNV